MTSTLSDTVVKGYTQDCDGGVVWTKVSGEGVPAKVGYFPPLLRLRLRRNNSSTEDFPRHSRPARERVPVKDLLPQGPSLPHRTRHVYRTSQLPRRPSASSELETYCRGDPRLPWTRRRDTHLDSTDPLRTRSTLRSLRYLTRLNEKILRGNCT